jgi:predicted phosphohydrolase
MRLWALSDPHLTFGNPGKPMHVFGENWRDHPEHIASNWNASVAPEDIVLVPGDISWASRLSDALSDLHFLDRLPGTKVILPGNHEHWWDSTPKVRRNLPPTLRAIDGDHLEMGAWLFFGTRLWEDPENDVDALIDWHPCPPRKSPEEIERNARIYRRELGILERCIARLPRGADRRRVCLTHYPPIGERLLPSASSRLIAESGAALCVFGHVHTVRQERLADRHALLGTAHGVRWALTSADVLDFRPVLLDESP